MTSEADTNISDDESSSPIGIFGLSPSSDVKIGKESTMSTFSPIGSPIASYIPSAESSPRYNFDINNHVFDPKIAKDSFLGLRLGDENEESIARNFDRLTISPNSRGNIHSSFQHNRQRVSPSGPNVPLLKHKSLPTQFLSSPNSLQDTNPFEFRSSHLKGQYLKVPGQHDISSRRSPRGQTETIWEDESKEDWFDQFGGIELEQQSNQSMGISIPVTSYLEISQSKHIEKMSYENSPSNVDSKRSSFNPQQYSSSYTTSTSNSYFVKKTQTNPQFRPTNSSSGSIKPNQNFNLKHNSRIISVQNANLFSINSLYSCFGKYGEIRSSSKLNNMFLFSYYDIRHSQAAMLNLNGQLLNDVVLELNFYFLKEFNNTDEVNQGTLVIFNLDPNVSISDLTKIFGEYGEIREIRESPNKKHKFIEFFDVREAELAMKNLNKSEINGKKIKIEPSKPSGKNETNRETRKSYSQVSSSAPSNTSPIHYRHHNDSDEYFQSSHKNRGKLIVQGRNNGNQKNFSPNHGSNQNDYDKFRDSEDYSEMFDLNITKILSKDDLRTTLMIKNIPNKYNQDMLLKAVNKNHDGLFDFLYLPIDFKNKCNVGYAFINFRDPLSIPSFYEEFNNKKWKKFNSEKVCQISYARIQGKYAMVEHFKNSSLLFEDVKCQPLIFHDGESEPLPIGSNFVTRNSKS